MKKLYVELVNIKLVVDVLGASTYDPTESTLPIIGDDDDPFEE